MCDRGPSRRQIHHAFVLSVGQSGGEVQAGRVAAGRKRTIGAGVDGRIGGDARLEHVSACRRQCDRRPSLVFPRSLQPDLLGNGRVHRQQCGARAVHGFQGGRAAIRGAPSASAGSTRTHTRA